MTYKEIKDQLKELNNQELSQLSLDIYATLRDEDMLKQQLEAESGQYCIENASIEQNLAFV